MLLKHTIFSCSGGLFIQLPGHEPHECGCHGWQRALTLSLKRKLTNKSRVVGRGLLDNPIHLCSFDILIYTRYTGLYHVGICVLSLPLCRYRYIDSMVARCSKILIAQLLIPMPSIPGRNDEDAVGSRCREHAKRSRVYARRLGQHPKFSIGRMSHV